MLLCYNILLSNGICVLAQQIKKTLTLTAEEYNLPEMNTTQLKKTKKPQNQTVQTQPIIQYDPENEYTGIQMIFNINTCIPKHFQLITH